jgi:hypothetical protein
MGQFCRILSNVGAAGSGSEARADAGAVGSIWRLRSGACHPMCTSNHSIICFGWHCQLNAKNLHLCAIRRKLYPIFFFHGSLYFRHLHPVSFPHEEGVCERFFIKLTMPNNLTMPYKGVIPAVQHRAITKQARKTNHIERFNNTLRQRVSRLVRETLSFSKTLANHIGALKYFICHYNLTRRGALPV